MVFGVYSTSFYGPAGQDVFEVRISFYLKEKTCVLNIMKRVFQEQKVIQQQPSKFPYSFLWQMLST